MNLAKRTWALRFPAVAALIVGSIASLYYLKGIIYQIVASIVLGFFALLLSLFGIIVLVYTGKFYKKMADLKTFYIWST